MSQRLPSIGRGAVAVSCDLLECIRTNAELEGLLLEYGLSDHIESGGSISKTLLNIKKFAVETSDFIVHSDYGEKPLPAVLIETAIKFAGEQGDLPLWQKLERYLNLDGYALQKQVSAGMFKEQVTITGFTLAIPEFAALPKAVNEVDLLLHRYGLTVAQRHLSSAKENISQEDWEAANSQCRTFLEALTDGIADRLFPQEAGTRKGGLSKRQLLADHGFLSREKHEFGDGNGQTFLPGVAKLLHPDGAHPGISTQHDAMFRLQLVVVTARWLLKRLETGKPMDNR
jgi:hypothetical protein